VLKSCTSFVQRITVITRRSPSDIVSAGARTWGQRGPGQFLVGHQDIASAGARVYNGGLEAEPPARSRGTAPCQGAESLFVFGRLIVQYFAVFIRFSGDNCMTLPEIEITW